VGGKDVSFYRFMFRQKMYSIRFHEEREEAVGGNNRGGKPSSITEFLPLSKKRICNYLKETGGKATALDPFPKLGSLCLHFGREGGEGVFGVLIWGGGLKGREKGGSYICVLLGVFPTRKRG